MNPPYGMTETVGGVDGRFASLGVENNGRAPQLNSEFIVAIKSPTTEGGESSRSSVDSVEGSPSDDKRLFRRRSRTPSVHQLDR